MSFELQMLVVAVGVVIVTIVIETLILVAGEGLVYASSPRDEQRSPSTLLGRANRTVRNHVQAMTLFTPLVLVAYVIDVSTPLTAWGAGLFAAARAVYVLLYLAGVQWVRTAVWTVGTVGLLLIGYEIVQAGF